MPTCRGLYQASLAQIWYVQWYTCASRMAMLPAAPHRTCATTSSAKPHVRDTARACTSPASLLQHRTSPVTHPLFQAAARDVHACDAANHGLPHVFYCCMLFVWSLHTFHMQGRLPINARTCVAAPQAAHTVHPACHALLNLSCWPTQDTWRLPAMPAHAWQRRRPHIL